jgi:hypothetical protein
LSNITGGFTAELSPDAVQTAIDAVMWEENQREQQPQYLGASDGFFFNTSGTDKYKFVYDEDQNVGMFEELGEQEEIRRTSTRIGNQTTATIVKYMKSIPISWEAFKADQVGKREKIGKQVGDRARLTQDFNAVLNTYGDAFAGSISTTPDGDAAASNSHTTLTGGNVDNLETGALAPDALWTQVTSLANQKAQDDDAGSYVFEGFVVPFTLYKTAKETMNSTLIANSGENNLNIFDTDYGTVMIRASIFLGSTYNGNSNANTSYHLLSRNHQVTRKVFSELNTNLIEPQYSDTDSWEHRSRFAEVSFWGSWNGYVGSNGSA